MEFDDSFFEDSGECGEGNPKPTEKAQYAVKRCEPEGAGAGDVGNSGTPETENHMLLKFRADFLYYRKQYSTAVEVYHRVLDILPPTNALVRREVTDSLARCQLHLGGYVEALEYAKSLVLPPHSRDSTSWQLLAQCHQQLGSVEEQVLALQRSAMLQRHHMSYWLQLSEGYEALNTHGVKEKCNADCSEKVELILSNTVALFRPYFRWRKPGPTPPDVWPSNRHDGHCTQETESQSRPHHMHSCSALEDSGPDGGNLSLCVQTDDGVRHDTSGCEADNLHTGCLKSGNHGNCLCGKDSCVSGASSACEACPENHENGDCGSDGCVRNTAVSDKELSRIEILQSGSMQGDGGENMYAGCCAGEVEGSVGCACPMCSPFCLLVGGKMTGGDILAWLGELPHETSREMLGSIYTMASCSCLIWTRQLLLYSVRYSSSFAREKQREELKRAESLLNGFHGNITKFLLGYFSKTSVLFHSTTYLTFELKLSFTQFKGQESGVGDGSWVFEESSDRS